MSNQTKLEFRLVPTKGVASGKGFRAEWTRKNEDAVADNTAESEG